MTNFWNKAIISLIILILIVFGVVFFCQQAMGQPNDLSQFLPDPTKTPGDRMPGVSATNICQDGYTKLVRNVDWNLNRAVYLSYGMPKHTPGAYEIDHLISLELGGSNSQSNLWPQSYLTKPWNAHVKDRLEDWMHASICNCLRKGDTNQAELLMQTYQSEISSNWISAYQKYIGIEPMELIFRGPAGEKD